MDSDDEMIVVVVADDDNSSECMEKFTSETSIGVEEFIKTAEKHGQFISVKEELEDGYQYNFHEYDQATAIKEEPLEHFEGPTETITETIIKEEKDDFFDIYEEEYYFNDNPDDPDYVPDSEDAHDVPIIPKTNKRVNKPVEIKSFVEELRQEYPDLKDNDNLLVNTLEQIMRTVKPPPPPRDFYIMNGIMFECRQCGSISDSIPAASRHYQEKHGPRYLMCYGCGVDFRSTTNLFKHEKRCSSPDKWLVLRARAAYVGPKGRGRPFISTAPRKTHASEPKPHKYACTMCSAVFITRGNLQSHENSHKGERPYLCNICPSAYTSRSALIRHTKMHSNAQFICDHCNRMFKMRAALVAHMDTHKLVRKHGCNKCDRRFAQKAALVIHIRRDHLNLPPPFACQMCPKRYPRMSLLKAHMKRTHGMTIITRKMFFKSLPTMSENEIRSSKVVVKVEATDKEQMLPKETQTRTNNSDTSLNIDDFVEEAHDLSEYLKLDTPESSVILDLVNRAINKID